jgi:uracil-DNA glycosylase
VGFFSESRLTQTRKPLPLLPRCGDCGLYYKGCESPKMPVSGAGRRGILVVGEAPGADEDKEGVQFVGRTGKKLRTKLQQLGLSPNQDCWFTNALICRPPGNKIKNQKMVDWCRPNLLKTIDRLKPKVIVLLGRTAVKSLIGWLWKEDIGEIARWVGWRIPSQRLNAWVCPTWHPSYLVRQEREDPVLEMLWGSHLKAAVSKTDRPWKTLPDYEAKVDVLADPEEVEVYLSQVKNGLVAFDLETNMLKPDSDRAKIVCCSVCINGKETFAFPWVKRTEQAMKRLLRSKTIGKIASNMKFEDRWTRAKLGIEVRNWDWDTMLAAHVLDNRHLISSVKFQAFVQLGQEPWNTHIEPFLKAEGKGGYSENRIDECDLYDLMKYCAMDSLLEYRVMTLQKRRLH